MTESKWARTLASSAQNRSFAAARPEATGCGSEPKGIVLLLPGPEAGGPRLQDPKVVDRVAVKDVVDPAPGRVAVDRRERQPAADGDERRVSRVEARPQVGRAEIGKDATDDAR